MSGQIFPLSLEEVENENNWYKNHGEVVVIVDS
jgi:hypothetical protein